MKFGKSFALFLALCLMVTTAASAKNLSQMFKNNNEIKLFVNDVTETAENSLVTADEFKSIFIQTMGERKEISFVPVNSKSEADAVIDIVVSSYKYNDSVLPRPGSYELVADIATPKNEAIIIADYIVSDPVTGAKLFELNNFVIDDKFPTKDNDEKSTLPLISKKSCNRFLFRAFYPKGDRDNR